MKSLFTLLFLFLTTPAMTNPNFVDIAEPEVISFFTELLAPQLKEKKRALSNAYCLTSLSLFACEANQYYFIDGQKQHCLEQFWLQAGTLEALCSTCPSQPPIRVHSQEQCLPLQEFFL